MKKWLIVLLIVAIVVSCTAIILLLVKDDGTIDFPTVTTPNNTKPSLRSDLSYNGEYLPYPIDISKLVDDGWYFYANNPSGFPVLVNNKYEEVAIVIPDANFANKDLAMVSDPACAITFDFSNECGVFPIVLLKGEVGYNSTREDVVSVLGDIAKSEGYYIGDSDYEFVIVVDKDDDNISYEITLVNGVVKSFTIYINNLIAVEAGE